MKQAEQLILESTLTQLKLPTIRRGYREAARAAEDSGASYESYLLALVSGEQEQRQANQLKRRLREAGFPQMKPLEQTDLAKWPGFEARKVKRLADGEYLQRKENIVLIGKHGTGKTHAALALGIEACRMGRRVKFTTAATLVNQLVEARDDRQLKNITRKLRAYHLLIVDELGYIPFSREGAQLLFQVLSERYEHASTLITTNLAFSEWNQVFGDANLTAALLDRVTHHCHIQQFNWESIRFTESMKNREVTA
ncbi:IS21-like element helper ATPase IstB [Acanthopleuribacter pedis]|uniref:IS21-like element helper ATPase IstB n=1 Tax=Acanthopleuribacter pedis TaxID=442870 RepID=A0A8J7U8E9_9BACT|nr:IS21-like element helper ATPase IstB [Acanthopleuribacter pedis]MBO1323518.1 IS21-like element helper ATPase IstB [Acanthopleuribacter pedis]